MAEMRRLHSLIIQAKYETFRAGRARSAENMYERGEAMKRTLMAVAAAATLAISSLAAPAPAHAQRGLGAGVAAGLLGGAIVGGAIASQNGYYGGPGYYGRGGGAP